jgi:hypothetical protein
LCQCSLIWIVGLLSSVSSADLPTDLAYGVLSNDEVMVASEWWLPRNVYRIRAGDELGVDVEWDS